MLGPLFIDVAGTALDSGDRELLAHPLVGGVILFARNYESPQQVQQLVSDIHALRQPRLLVCVDQEGGRVQRFRDGFVDLPPLHALGACYAADPQRALALTADHAWLMASELAAVGIDFSFAPVLDLHSAASSVIGERAFHAEPQAVAALGRRYIGALHERGMAAVGKHFPGHGSVAADSHHELPIDRRSFYDIESRDLLPFRAAIDGGLDGVMMAHVAYPDIDDVAAGYSAFWIGQTLRRDMRFEGAVFSDDLSMAGAADAGDYPDRARAALDAGCDVLLACNRREAIVAIVDDLGERLFPRTQARLMRLHRRGSGTPLAELRQTPRWREVSSTLAALVSSPELDLGDDNLLG